MLFFGLRVRGGAESGGSKLDIVVLRPTDISIFAAYLGEYDKVLEVKNKFSR
jgi:hypothetical protein